jgi:hypothetical protein
MQMMDRLVGSLMIVATPFVFFGIWYLIDRFGQWIMQDNAEEK